MPICKRCDTDLPVNDFYKNDSTCKECRKRLVRENRKKNIQYYREYDRKRAGNADRVCARRKYQKTENGIAAMKRSREKYMAKYPLRRAAHIIVGNALRDNKMQRMPCEDCGSENNVHAHHDDYTKPLEVRWLCRECHTEWHKHNTPVYE